MKSEPDSGPIWSAWNNGGTLIGANKPYSVVTVEPAYALRTSMQAGGYTKLPVRWYQASSGNGQELVIPGLRRVEIHPSIDTEAATATFTFTNARLDPDFAAASWQNTNGDFGDVGYLTADRGTITNRWGYQPNEWNGILTRNALIRSYFGYGGQGKTIAQAIADGNLVKNGVWLVDDNPISTGDGFVLQCRDMAKLLVEQQIFYEFVPVGLYPLQYSHFWYQDVLTPVVIYGHAAANPNSKITGLEVAPGGDGYWMVGTDGGVFTYGLAHFWGSVDTTSDIITPAAYPKEGITGIARTTTGNGYWLVRFDGGVYAFGDAILHGNASIATGTEAIAIEHVNGTDGYWICSDTGAVFSFGAAQYFGGSPGLVANAKIVGMASTKTGLGYWLVDSLGHVYSYGDAAYYGGITFALARPITGICTTPSGNGYYLVGGDGGVFTYGDAVYRGSVPAGDQPFVMQDGITTIGTIDVGATTDEFQPSDVGRGITGAPIPANTTVTGYIDPRHIQVSNASTLTNPPENPTTLTIDRQIFLQDPVTDLQISPDNSGYWLTAEDGGVFVFKAPGSDMQFLGSLPGQTDFSIPTAGNLPDYSTIAKDLALWAGFWLNDGGASDGVYGVIENTGAWPQLPGSNDAIPILSDVFDKKSVMAALKTIRDVLGYQCRVGDEGEFIWRSPNFWSSGNFLPNMTHTATIPVIDERKQLLSYTRSTPDKDLRSKIIISTDDPEPSLPGSPYGGPPGTITTEYVPRLAPELRGMIKPGMWIQLSFTSPAEQQIMAELIALHIEFRSRLGSVSCLYNPMIQIDDQVQIIERETNEVNTHYVRSIDAVHDLKTGEATMSITTNVLSPPGPWAVVKPAGTPGGHGILINRPA